MAVSGLASIGRERVSNDAANQIKAFIQQQGIVPGQRLPSERELGENLQISRASLREAIRGLESEGILEVRHGIGTFLQHSATAAFMHDAAITLVQSADGPLALMKARLAVEPMIAELAAREPAPSLLKRLEGATDAMEEQITSDDVPTRNHDLIFHETLAELCNNPILGEFGCRLCVLRQKITWTQIMDASLHAAETQRSFVDQHRKVIKAIKDKNGAAAFQSMYDHIQQTHDVVASLMESK